MNNQRLQILKIVMAIIGPERSGDPLTAKSHARACAQQAEHSDAIIQRQRSRPTFSLRRLPELIVSPTYMDLLDLETQSGFPSGAVAPCKRRTGRQKKKPLLVRNVLAAADCIRNRSSRSALLAHNEQHKASWG